MTGRVLLSVGVAVGVGLIVVAMAIFLGPDTVTTECSAEHSNFLGFIPLIAGLCVLGAIGISRT